MDASHADRQKAFVEKAHATPGTIKVASALRSIPHSEKLVMDSDSAPKPRAAATTSAPLYAIAIGAFAVKNNADVLSARLSAYDARVTPFARNGAEMWRVELGAPGSRGDAHSALAFARALGFPHAWIVDRGRLSRSAEKSASNTIVNRGARTRNRVPRMRPSLNT
jgi:cell division protein FtsN